MTNESFKRKLTAILSADVEGYSRLMGQDEDATIGTLTAYRELMATLIQKHRGRVVDSPGDNLLAEFTSVVDAVRCAVEIQEELRVRNAELPENRRMHFRIGINLGDVVEEGERIYGDGVNITARVEGLAKGGGICISGTVYDSIKNKLSLSYEPLGEHTVKNITEPVRVYRMRVGPEAAIKTGLRRWQKAALAAVVVLVVAAGAWAIWNFYFRPPPIEPASVERMAFPLPEKPSIAVLPFVNMSEDPNQEYFSDGITEEIITALSKTPKMLVIARNSTFSYKDKPVKVHQVAEELGVQYVLEGSVRKAGDKVRITAQLVDTLTGHHLWAERYDRNLTDIFAVQDEITKKIFTALQVKLTEGEHARLWGKGTDNLDAYLKYVQAREQWRRFVSKETNAQARQMAMEAIALDPNYPVAYGQLGYTHWADLIMNWSESRKNSMQQLVESCQKAMALDDSIPMLHTLQANIYLMKKQFDKARAEGERAVSVCPNCTENKVLLGHILRFMGKPEEAIQVLKQAIRLDPFPTVMAYHNLAMSYVFAGMPNEALETFKKALKVEPNNLPANLGLAVTYASLGREEDARTVGTKILEINPKFSVKAFAKKLPYKNQAYRVLLIDGLIKAGLPETPPLPLPDKPCIAVLPFVNMSGDPEQEYFSDGITEEIITALSKTSKLFVIARTSSFKYKSREVDVRKVSRELGVRYVLEGSVRRSEGRLRVTAQLVDAQSGHHLWAERYDRELKDIFAIQDEITIKIVTGLQIKLTEGEQARMWGKKAKNLDVCLKGMEAGSLWRKGTKESIIRFGQLAQEIVDMAPDHPSGYRNLAWYNYWLAGMGRSKSPRESIGKAFKLAKKALDMDKSNSSSHALLGGVYLWMRQYEKAIAEGERSVELDPNGAMAHGLLGKTLSYAGRQDEAIDHLKQGIRLNPFPAYWYYRNLGRCYMLKGQYEEALTEFEKALHRAPDAPANHVSLAIIYGLLGRQEEARAATKKYLEINPNFSVERASKTLPFKNQADLKFVVDAMHKAGFK